MKLSIRNLSLIAGILAGTNIAAAAPNVYIPLGAANKIQVIDSASHQVICTVNDVGNTHGLAVTPDGRYLVAGTFSKPAAGTQPAAGARHCPCAVE